MKQKTFDDIIISNDPAILDDKMLLSKYKNQWIKETELLIARKLYLYIIYIVHRFFHPMSIEDNRCLIAKN